MRLQEKRLSLYQVKPDTSGRLVTQEGKYLDTTSYSKSKYGDRNVAREYGYALADLAATQHADLIFSNDRVLVTSSAFKSLPTSSHNIAQGFLDEVNYLRYLNDQSPTDKIKIVRPTVIEGDFGTQSKEDRLASLRNEPFYIDADLVKDSHLIVIDDVVITGANERKISDTVDPLGLLSLYFLYAVEMDAQTAQEDPSIENKMNHAFVSNLSQLAHIIDIQKQYDMLQRVTKSILRPVNHPEELRDFLKNRDNEFVYGLYTSAINDGIGKMSSYQGSLQILEQELQERGLLVFGRLIPPGTSLERGIITESIAASKLRKAQKEGKPLRLAFLDIDGTMSGNPQDQAEIRKLLVEQGYITIFVTSRSAEMVMSEDSYKRSKHDLKRPEPKLGESGGRRVITFANNLLNETGLYDPDIIVSSTGTDILPRQEKGNYSQDKIFRKNELDAHANWRQNALELLHAIDPQGDLFTFSYIEDPDNYRDGTSYVFPHDLRIRIDLKAKDNSTAIAGKTELRNRLQHVQEHLDQFSPEIQRTIKNLRLTDENNSSEGKYAIYFSPSKGSKAQAVDYVIDQLCHQLQISKAQLHVLIAGDSMPDLEMGLTAGQGTNSTFLVPGGSELRSVITQQHAFYADEALPLRRNALTQGNETGKLVYTATNGSQRSIILSEEIFPNTKAGTSLIAFLKAQTETS